jgi:hypothetical protein
MKTLRILLMHPAQIWPDLAWDSDKMVLYVARFSRRAAAVCSNQLLKGVLLKKIPFTKTRPTNVF